MKELITKAMILDGIQQDLITVKLNPDLRCYIGEMWFYIGGSEYETSDPATLSIETIVNEIIFVLDDFRTDIKRGTAPEFEDEYKYYYWYLKENLK